MGPKLKNCCRPEPMGTQGHGKISKRIQVLEDGRVPAKEARGWRIEGQKRRTTRKECQRHVNNLEGFMAKKGLWNPCQRENPEGKRRAAKGRVTSSESTRPCMKKVS